MTGESQVIVERHNIDHRHEECPDLTGQAKIPMEILTPVTLMRQYLADFPRHLTYEFSGAHVRTYRQPQWQHV